MSSSVTREPSDSASDCPEHLCITRIWKKGIDGASAYLSKEISDMDTTQNFELLSDYDDDEDEDEEDFEDSMNCNEEEDWE
jgi:hypothetical protein